MKILHVVGARPNFVKIAPLMEEFERYPHTRQVLVHTGQHYDADLSKLFFDQLQIPRPDINLEVGTGNHGKQTGEIMQRLEPVLEQEKPDLVVVVGDVNSTLAGALTAAKLMIPIAHIEAGLRSFDRSMPEEINRLLTDTISDYMFATEQSAVENLLREGRSKERIFLVGNIMIDSLRKWLPLAKRTAILSELGLLTGDSPEARTNSSANVVSFALVTLHRPANVDAPTTLRALLEVLSALGQQVPVIFPVHPRTRQGLELAGFPVPPDRQPANGPSKGLRLIAPLGYLQFVQLMSEAALVLTDSGGVQEETTALGVPCLTIRPNTERPVTVTHGTNQVVGNDPDRILSAARQVLHGKPKPGTLPPLWDGQAAERIVQVLLQHFVGPHSA